MLAVSPASPGEFAEAPAARPSSSRSETGVFAPLLVKRALAEGVRDGEVAHDKGTGEEQADRHEPHEAAPAFGYVDAGRVFHPRVRALDGSPPCIRAPLYHMMTIVFQNSQATKVAMSTAGGPWLKQWASPENQAALTARQQSTTGRPTLNRLSRATTRAVRGRKRGR